MCENTLGMALGVYLKLLACLATLVVKETTVTLAELGVAFWVSLIVGETYMTPHPKRLEHNNKKIIFFTASVPIIYAA